MREGKQTKHIYANKRSSFGSKFKYFTWINALWCKVRCHKKRKSWKEINTALSSKRFNHINRVVTNCTIFFAGNVFVKTDLGCRLMTMADIRAFKDIPLPLKVAIYSLLKNIARDVGTTSKAASYTRRLR